MKNRYVKVFLAWFTALLIACQVIPLNASMQYDQTIAADNIWESLSDGEYREWKSTLYNDYSKKAESDGVQSPMSISAYAVTAYQNLFGNEYLEAYVGNDGRFTMGTTGGNPNSTTDKNKKLLYGYPSPWSSFTTIKIDGYNYTFYADGPPAINSAGTEAVSTMTVTGVTIRQVITLVSNPVTNRSDVFRITYQMTNNSGAVRSLGARIMLDTQLMESRGGLQHVYYSIEYYNGSDLFTTSAEVAINDVKSTVFSISENDLSISPLNYSLTSGRSSEGYAELQWGPVAGAESCNIYSRDMATDAFVKIGNATGENFLTDIMWEDEDTVYLYVEPVYADGVTDAFMVSVPNSDYTFADFSADPHVGNSPLTVTFTDQSIGNHTSLYWDFGDGETSNDKNPIHTYMADGIYTVKLTASGASGESYAVKRNYIVVGRWLESLDLDIPSEVNVGEQIDYQLFGNYSDGLSEQIKGGYVLFSSNEAVISVDGDVLTAVSYGDAVINVFCNNVMTAKAVNVKDKIVSVSLDYEEITTPGGTLLEDITIPETATLVFESGNVSVAPILWFDDTEPLYDANVLDNSRFVLTGIVDVASNLLPEGVDSLVVNFTINVEVTSEERYQVTVIAGGGKSGSGAGAGVKNGSIAPAYQNVTLNVTLPEEIETPLGGDIAEFYVAELYADELYKLALFIGTGKDSNGDPIFSLEKPLSRIEALTLVIRLLGEEDAAISCACVNPFIDMPDWGVKYAAYGFANGLTVGVNDEHTLFEPDRPVSLQEFSAFILRALGYYEKDGDFAYDDAIEKAASIGVYTSDDAAVFDEGEFIRRNAVIVMVGALHTNINGSDDILLLDKLANAGVFTEEAAEAFLQAIETFRQ